jgi:hypothetical protein
MTGVLAVTAGTAALPAITPSGDPNTGIYSPGADQLAISTNGTGRLFIDSSGRALIGTSTAHGQNYLQIQGDQTNGPLGIGAISLRRGSALVDMGANSTLGRLEFAFVDGGVGAQIAAVCDAAGAGTNDYPGRLVFSTTADNAASPTERMRLDSSGGLQFKGAGTAGVTQAVSFNGSAPVNSLVIDSTGKVGLGTSSPTKELEVSTSSGATISIRSSTAGSIASPKEMRLSFTGVTSNGVTPTEKAFIYSVDQQFDTSSSFLGFGTNLSGTGLAERMRITAEGRVGIGTTTVSSPLHVKANSTEGIRIESPDFTGIYGLLTSRRSSGAPLDIAAIHSVGSLAPEISFSRSTNGSTFTESARIDSSGRLLVGTSTARTFAFSIVPRIQLEETTVSNGISITTNRNDGSGNILHFGKSRSVALGGSGIVNSGDSLGAIRFQGADGSALVSSAEIAAAVDGTPGANDMPGRLVFSTTADGASSPTERARITNAGAIAIGTTSLPSGTNAIWLDPASGERRFSRSATTAVFQIAFHNPNGLVGHIETSGSSTSYVTSSDYRLKENVVLLTGAIDRLQQIPVHRFNFIADPNTVVDGFLAHEAQAVVPECVTGAKDEVDEDGNPVYQGIDQSKLVPLLTAALQEALQKIEDLEGRLTAAGL